MLGCILKAVVVYYLLSYGQQFLGISILDPVLCSGIFLLSSLAYHFALKPILSFLFYGLAVFLAYQLLISAVPGLSVIPLELVIVVYAAIKIVGIIFKFPLFSGKKRA